MSRRVLDLSSLAWQMGQAPRQPFSATPADDRGQVAEWLPANVPGDVRADLIAAGRIPPIETPEGIAAGAWVDGCDWWYRVRVPGWYAPDEIAVLEADGIDYYSAVWLDGRLLATHVGMFAPQNVTLSSYLSGPGPHELAIRVWGGGALPRLPNPPLRRAVRWLVSKCNSDTEYFPDRMATPKAQFSFGWDFTPCLLSAGIWDDMRLIAARGAYIEDLWVRAEPLTERDDPTPARWRLRLRVARWKAGPARAEIVLQPENFAGVGSREVPRPRRRPPGGYQTLNRTVELCSQAVGPCTENYEFTLDMAAARRWWPWDQGEPCLYGVTVRLLDDAGVLDEISQVVGLRSVARAELPGGRAPWRFVVNGRPVFLRGANWVPADILPGCVAEADYERLLGQARAAGVNFLRVWGGGIREKRAFWDRCDRLGIMAWQEFPLACAFLDHYPRDRVYLATLTTEALGIVRALRNHPSLIAWCGGNEINPARERRLLQAIADVLAQADLSRPWIPVSPGEGDIHQWDVWHGFAPWSELAEDRAPFMSEFGMQALPDAATAAEMFPGVLPVSLADLRWAGRKAQVAKLRHYAGQAADGDLSTAIAATQRVQATALQTGLEACRLRRDTCGGVAFWQLNEPWPAVTWSVIDRAGRPKAAYDMLCRSFQPVLIAARFPWRAYRGGETFRAEIWLVNDGPKAWHGCRAEAALDGQATWALEGIELVPANARAIGELAWKLDAPPRWMTLQLACGAVILASNHYDLAVPLPGPRGWRGRLTRWLVDRLLDTG